MFRMRYFDIPLLRGIFHNSPIHKKNHHVPKILKPKFIPAQQCFRCFQFVFTHYPHQYHHHHQHLSYRTDNFTLAFCQCSMWNIYCTEIAHFHLLAVIPVVYKLFAQTYNILLAFAGQALYNCCAMAGELAPPLPPLNF